MIVVSGVLVLVALVFLILGLFGDGLNFIWASIITSVVAGVFLLLGALQRRGTPSTAADSGTGGLDAVEPVTAVSVRSRDDLSFAAEETADAGSASGGEVAVVPGRPRYHTAACRFLAGRPDVETISIDAAKGEGYTACGVCKPDAAVAAAAAASEAPAAEESEATATDTLDDTAAIDTSEVEAATTPTRGRKAPAKKAATPRTRTAAATSATEEVAAAPAKATRATKAAAKPATAAGSVVAVPDRGKYHVETCRFANVPGAMTMTRTAAKRQGLAPCGVCKP